MVNTIVGFPSTYISAAGQELALTRNETGHYVSSGGETARIIRADVPLANGIMHVIDRVLMNTNGTAPTLAPAASSAAAAAGVEPTGKVSSALVGPYVSVSIEGLALVVSVGFVGTVVSWM